MSFSANLVVGDRPVGYTVQVVDGVTLVTGSVPVDQFVALTKSAGKKAVMSERLARLAGTNLAFGPVAAIDALEERLTQQTLRSRPNMSPLERWLAVGHRGLSSESIVAALRPGTRGLRGTDHHPHDPGDLLRCVQLLDEVPELRVDFGRMAQVSVEWGALVAAWPELEAELRAETSGLSTAAPRTYALMKKVLSSACTSDLDKEPRSRDKASTRVESG